MAVNLYLRISQIIQWKFTYFFSLNLCFKVLCINNLSIWKRALDSDYVLLYWLLRLCVDKTTTGVLKTRRLIDELHTCLVVFTLLNMHEQKATEYFAPFCFSFYDIITNNKLKWFVWELNNTQ